MFFICARISIIALRSFGVIDAIEFHGTAGVRRAHHARPGQARYAGRRGGSRGESMADGHRDHRQRRASGDAS